MLKSALAVFLVSCLLGRLDCTVQTELTVKRGEDATLHCYGPTDATIVLLRWEKPDLQSDLYVFYFRNGRPNENYELPRFKDRVKLKDPEMKNGNFTVILKNVSMNDAGIYECHAGYKNQRPQLMNSINLKVEEPEQKNITAESGQNVTLTCRAPNNNNNKTIVGVEWSRADLKEEYVLLYRDDFELYKQHPAFKSRVDLQDSQMKDGDVSLILKNVTTADSGRYEARVKMGKTFRKRAYVGGDPFCTFNLRIVPHGQKIITAESGQNVTLTCRGPNHNIIAVEWSRADLKSQYVFVCWDGQVLPEEQHPSFKNRVDLQDRQMKDGDVSVILKNVTINDAGTYECRVQRGDDSVELISIIYLSVAPPGSPEQNQEDGGKEDGARRAHLPLVVPL